MDIEAYFSRSREFYNKSKRHLQDCDEPECQKQDSPFSPNLDCDGPADSIREEEETDLQKRHCRSYKDECIPVIFDRRYDYSDRELCSRSFSLRLGGLRNRMSAALRRYLGCKVQIGYECESTVKKVKGIIGFVGTDFVEMSSFKEESDCTHSLSKKSRMMIPFDSINWIEYDSNKNA